MKQARQDAKEALKKAADLEVPTCFEPYQLGDKVWLKGRNLTTMHPTAKLAPRHYSPFPITWVISRVMFGLNVRLDLSGKATTKSLCALCTKLSLKILGEGTRTVAVRVIRGDEGVGAIPGVRGGSGESSEVLRNIARLTQELRLKV